MFEVKIEPRNLFQEEEMKAPTEQEEKKAEDNNCVPGTSFNDISEIINNNDNSIENNNNNSDTNKNLNSSVEEQSTPKASTTRKRVPRVIKPKVLKVVQNRQSLARSSKDKQASLAENEKENVHEPAASPRNRRSSNRQDNSNNDKTMVDKSRVSIANRLRSQGNASTNEASKEEVKSTPKQSQINKDNNNIIQFPTSLLNKILNALNNSKSIDVSVKEAASQGGGGGDLEDVSFMVELCKKQEDADPITVQAQVFPDQGNCLVDKQIVALLKDQNNVEINSIVSSILNVSKESPKSSSNKPKTIEEKDIVTQNPEELFKIDGEEILVGDNVEQILVNNQTSYSCKLCRKVYERRDKCTVHVKTHLGIKQYTCIICQARFVCKSDVMKHIRCSHTNPRPVSCPKCPKRFRSKFDLAEHNNVHKGVKPYQCSDCDQSYHHKVSLQMHVKSHLPPQNLACEYCGKVFPFRTRLLSHIGSVHMKSKRNFRCRFCYNLYSSLAVLNDHIKTRHMTTYTCDVCGKSFKVSSKFKAHVLQHSNPKPYVCNICNNKYASKAFLNEHVLKHQGLRKHICQTCGASFAQASHLAAHRHVHGDKTHACPDCGKKFNRRDNMKVHRRRHFANAAKKQAEAEDPNKDADDADEVEVAKDKA